MTKRGSLGRLALCAANMWVVASAIWAALIFGFDILQPMIDFLIEIEGNIGVQTLDAISAMRMKLSITINGVLGLAVLAIGSAALAVKVPGMPGWAIMLIAVLADAVAAAIVTPPDIVIQLAFIGCGLVGTALGLVWARRGTKGQVGS